MIWPTVYLVLVAVTVVDALVAVAALHRRFNPRLAFRQRACRFRKMARGQVAQNPTHNGCNAA